MALLDQVGPFAQYWGLAVGAWNDPELARGGGPKVQYIWNSINQDYLARGETMPASSFGAVNALIKHSSAVDRAMKSLGESWRQVQQSGVDQAIDPKHIASDIDAPMGGGSFPGATFRVRFRADTTIGGMGLTEWFNWSPGANLPATVAGLMNSLDIIARGFAEDRAQGGSGPYDAIIPTGEAVITAY